MSWLQVWKELRECRSERVNEGTRNVTVQSCQLLTSQTATKKSPQHSLPAADGTVQVSEPRL